MESIDDIIEERKKIAKRNICYLNDNDEIVTEEEATKVIITEYDEGGNVINSIIGSCNNDLRNIEEER